MEHQKDRKGQERRFLIKGLFAAGAAAVLGSAAGRKARASKCVSEGAGSKEILYRETEEFRAYYDSLLD